MLEFCRFVSNRSQNTPAVGKLSTGNLDARTNFLGTDLSFPFPDYFAQHLYPIATL